MTRDRARKKAIRARMAASGEPYSVAARKLAATVPADDTAAVREIIARANSTLAAPSARIEVRIDFDFAAPARPERRPGLVARLARQAAKAAWARLAPDVDASQLREAFAHQAGEGFAEPAASRYLIDYGGYAVLCADGKLFGGRSGQLLQARHPERRGPERQYDPLRLLRLLQGAKDARHVGDQVLRGTPCRTVAVWPGPPGLTVWIDHEHIRQVQFQERASSKHSSLSKKQTLELWDFGVPVGGLDWSHLPNFKAPADRS